MVCKYGEQATVIGEHQSGHNGEKYLKRIYVYTACKLAILKS